MSHACAASLFDFKERLVDPYILLTKFRSSGRKCMRVVHGGHADQHKLRRSLVRCCDEFLLANNAIVGPRPAGCLVSGTYGETFLERSAQPADHRTAVTPRLVRSMVRRKVAWWNSRGACQSNCRRSSFYLCDRLRNAIQIAAETKCWIASSFRSAMTNSGDCAVLFLGPPRAIPDIASGRAEDESNLLTCDVDATVLSVWMPLDSKASRI